jgi:hypothetical protein
MFSSRPNPVWIVAGEGETKESLDAVRAAEGAVAGYVRAGGMTLSDQSHSIERFLVVQLPPDIAALRARLEGSFPPGN